MSELNPFLGARPYGLAQSAMFFGRDAAQRELAQLIQLHPVVAVVAPSGIGKTSLLRAAVIPELEMDGLLPVYLRPDPRPETENDGALALLDGGLERAIIRALTLDPALEATCLDHIARHWGTRISLQEAAGIFRGGRQGDEGGRAELREQHVLREALLDPGNEIVERLPILSRYLNGTIAEEALFEIWNQADPELGAAFAKKAGVGRLSKLLRKRTLAARLKEARARLETAGGLLPPPHLVRSGNAVETRAVRSDDAPNLKPRVAAVHSRVEGPETPGISFPLLHALIHDNTGPIRLVRPDGDLDLKPRIVMVIDQFEQIFTLARQENRERLLVALAELADAELPVHLVLALRKEWYAELNRHFVTHQSRMPGRSFETFHLDSVTRSEARQIMKRAPESVGAPPIPAASQERVWENLQNDGFLDAVTLSVACHELFEMARDQTAHPSDTDVLTAFDVQTLLTNYLNRSLRKIDDAGDVLEAIDILGEIAGSGITRDFVTESRIVNAPLRNPAKRRQLLERLQQLFLIRGDNPRPGSEKLFDIMHERLIGPVRAIVELNPEVTQLRNAAVRIEQPDATKAGMDFEDLRIILLSYHRLNLSARAASVVLAGLLRLDWTDRDEGRVKKLAEECGRDDAETWYRDMLERFATGAGAPGAAEIRADWRLEREWWLTDDEFRAEMLRVEMQPFDESRYLLLINTLLRRTPGDFTRALVHKVISTLRNSQHDR